MESRREHGISREQVIVPMILCGALGVGFGHVFYGGALIAFALFYYEYLRKAEMEGGYGGRKRNNRKARSAGKKKRSG